MQLLNWRDFQHYKNRDVPWVKFYYRLVHDREYRALSHEARCLLTDLWLIGSRSLDGVLTESPDELAWTLRETVPWVVTQLREIVSQRDSKGLKWLELDPEYSACLDNTYSESCLEKEGEGEGEREKEKESTSPPATALALVRRDTPEPNQLPAPIAEVATRSDRAKELRHQLEQAAGLVFSYACAAWGKTNGYALDEKRRKRLMARLREFEGDPTPLLYAADGAKRDDFLSGRDPKAPRCYLDISTVYRDREQVERLRDLVPQRAERHPVLAELLARA